MMRRTALAIVVSAALIAIMPAHAQVVYASDAGEYATSTAPSSGANPAPLPAAAEWLKPGEFHWLGSPAGSGSLVILVSLADQRATVFRNGEAIAVTTVSTGMPGRETPTGVYPILAKKKIHHSNLYDNAPMPFMQRLTWDGIALHAGRIPGRPASHGCIRLPKQFAQQLFSITERGQSVIISDDASVEALLRVGVPAFLADRIGRRSDTGDGYAGSVSYQDTDRSPGGSAN